MPDKQEARQAGKLGRATYQRRYTGIIPHRDFERGCFALGALLLAEWAVICLMWAAGW